MSVHGRCAWGVYALAFMGVAGGCNRDTAVDLLVDLKTDLVPGLEFSRVRLERFDRIPGRSEVAPAGGVLERGVQPNEPFERGVRVAVYEALQPGNHTIRVRLIGSENEVVLERVAILSLRRTSVFTIVMTRDCRTKICPAPEDDPGSIACVGGRCVSPECTPETPEFCPSFTCDVSVNCLTSVACAEPLCSGEGVCLRVGRSERCATNQVCNPEVGCVPDPSADAGTDATVADAGAQDAAPDGASPDAALATMPWGEWAASLAVPACPAAPVLTVNTTTAENDGGTTITDPSQAGALLSFPEALWISVNRAGPDTIEFDPLVFPVDAPGRIVVPATTDLSARPPEVCIDARGRGVIVEWEAGVVDPNVWGLQTGSLMVGLTVLSPPFEISIVGSQVAGCRIGTDGWTSFPVPGRPWMMNLYDSGTLGPGNVFGGSTYAVRQFDGWTVRDNYVGFDPLTGAEFPLRTAVDVRNFADTTVFESNVLAVSFGAFSLPNAGGRTLEIRNNRVGISPDGTLFSGPRGGFDLRYATGVIANNVIRSTSVGVNVQGTAVFHLTQNSIRSDTAAIQLTSPPFAAPIIDSANPTGASGTCAVDGTVEVFEGANGQPENYLGSGACAGGTWSVSWASALPGGSSLTATLTDTTPQTSDLSAPFAL